MLFAHEQLLGAVTDHHPEAGLASGLQRDEMPTTFGLHDQGGEQAQGPGPALVGHGDQFRMLEYSGDHGVTCSEVICHAVCLLFPRIFRYRKLVACPDSGVANFAWYWGTRERRRLPGEDTDRYHEDR